MEKLNISKKRNMYCLNDWVENIVHSKDPRSYCRKIKYPKENIDGKWYVDENSMKEIYDRSTLMHGKGINGPYGKYGKLYKHGDKKKDTLDKQVVKEKVEKRKPVVYKMDSFVGKKTYDDSNDNISEYSVDEDYELDDIDLGDNMVDNAIIKVEPVVENRLIDISNGVMKFDGKDISFTVDNNQETWFKGGDISSVLEYIDPKNAIQNNVDTDDKMMYSKLSGIERAFSNTPFGSTENIKLSMCENKKIHPHTIYINESGLYSLIMKSKMKKAKEFQRWVTKEVLPSIRKTGQYNIQDSIKTNTVPQLAYDMNDYLNKNAIYLLHMENDIYKFGVTKNMKVRDSDLKRMKYKSIHKIFTVKNNDIGEDVENMIKAYLKQLEIRRHFNIHTREVLMPYNKTTDKGTCTEFFAANAETLAMVEKNITDFILIKTNEYNTKQGIEDKVECAKLQIELAKLTKDKNIQDEITSLNIQKEIYSLRVEEAKITSDNIKQSIEDTKLKLELERLKYGGDKYIRDNPEKDILIKTHKNHKCINDICTKLTHEKGKMCHFCSCKRRVLRSKENGRPSYSTLQNDLTHMNHEEIGTKYNTTGQSIGTWIKTYERYNLLG